MNLAIRRLLISGLALGLGALAACSPQSHYYGRSLATSSPQQARLVQRTAVDAPAGALPWYAARNDALPTTYAGYESATVEYIHTRTYDRQRSFGNHVRNDYTRRTHSTTIRQIVR
mgnify:CR=1 FL=1